MPAQSKRYATMANNSPTNARVLQYNNSPRQMANQAAGELDIVHRWPPTVGHTGRHSPHIHTMLSKQLLNTSSSSFCQANFDSRNQSPSPLPGYTPAPHSQLIQQKKVNRTELKQRLSTFELNKGLHKERSSQMRLENQTKIHEMMSKLPRASPRMKGLRLNSQSPELNKINVKDLAEPQTQANEGEITSDEITGTNL